jgi:protein O-mannosyl-transferase
MKRLVNWLPLLPVILGFVLYLPSLTYDFVYDDHWTVDGNPHLRIWPGVDRVFTSDIWGLTSYPARSNYYRPAFFLANWATAHSISESPWAFHLVNVLMHALAVALVWMVSMNLVSDRRVAFIAASLFAVHPIHTEAVAWITDIVDLGCTVFFLFAVFLYTRAGRGSAVTDLAIAASYFAALLWKEPAATFPLVVVAYDLIIRREVQWRRYVPVVSVTAIYFLLRYQALGGIVPIAYHTAMKASEYPLIAATGLGTYLSKLIAPVELSMYYDPVAPSLAYGLLLAGVIAAGALLWRRHREISWATFWIVLTLSPALAVSRISMPISERNLYLASVGYCLVIALLLSKLEWRLGSVLAAALAGLFAIGTLGRLAVWRDDLTLYSTTLRTHPNAPIIRMNLATELARRGDLAGALEQVDIVLTASPSDTGVLANKATLKSRQGDWQSATDACTRALALDPKMASCLRLLAMADQQSGNLASALQKLDRALSIEPGSYDGHYYRGNVYAQMGRLEEAVSEYQQALTTRPTTEGFNNLGSTYFQMKRLDASIESYQTALKLDPGYTLARENLDALLRWRNEHAAEERPSR